MEFTLKTTFNATPKEVYDAWMNSESHTEMTGGDANIQDEVGTQFSAWDDYITGQNLELVANQKIVQSWRTTEFEESDEDSKIEILLKEANGETNLTLIHTNLSLDGKRYKNGWIEHYFEPMKAYFS
jgi:uncharacterized protein YndB with AHSA1/START domain